MKNKVEKQTKFMPYYLKKDALMERYKMTELHLLELYGEELKSIREDLLSWNSISNSETNRNDIAVQEQIINGIRKLTRG